MTDPQEYAKWCEENLPKGWAMTGESMGDGCDAQNIEDGNYSYFPHAALSEIARLRAQVADKRGLVVDLTTALSNRNADIARLKAEIEKRDRVVTVAKKLFGSGAAVEFSGEESAGVCTSRSQPILTVKHAPLCLWVELDAALAAMGGEG